MIPVKAINNFRLIASYLITFKQSRFPLMRLLIFVFFLFKKILKLIYLYLNGLVSLDYYNIIYMTKSNH